MLVAARCAVFAAACASLVWVVSRATSSGDYQLHGLVGGDNAALAINALVHGRLTAMVHLQPLMGLVSLLWRAPFTALGTSLGGGSQQVGYELGCAACFLPLAGLVGWMASRASCARELALVVCAAAAVAVGPATVQAVTVGHPEDVLAAVLATAAVLSATGGRRGWAAVLLGLAIGTKQWALLATPCVLLAVPNGRARMAALAGAVALPAIALLPLADPSAFARADAWIGGLRFVEPFSVWWIGGVRTMAHSGDRFLPGTVTRSEAAGVALLLALLAVWAYGRRDLVRRGRPVDGLALLALVGLLRCVTDPDPLTYNFVAVVIPLAVWEATVLRRVPVLTAASCAFLWLLPTGALAFDAGWRLWPGPLGLWLISTVGALALACALVARLFGPAPVGQRARGHFGRRSAAQRRAGSVMVDS